MKLLLFMFVFVTVEQLNICLRRNKTLDDVLPDWKTLWQKANFSSPRRTRKPRPTPTKSLKPRMFPNLSTVMDAFEHAKTDSVYRVEALNVLTSFEENCLTDHVRRDNDDESASVLRKPYIVLEADFMHLKRHFMTKLSQKIRAVVMRNPPGCLFEYRNHFPYTNSLRSAYFLLGEYAISYNVTTQWQRNPVLLTGSWADRTSNAVCKAFRFQELPPAGNEVYVWPKDLLKPDVLIFLHNSTHVKNIPTKSRHYYKFKQLEWYLKLQGPKVAVINVTNFETKGAILQNVISSIKEIVGNGTDISNIQDIVQKRTNRPRRRRKQKTNTTTALKTSTTHKPRNDVTESNSDVQNQTVTSLP